MRAVVTGSAGFIGRYLVDDLIARGYRVTGIDRQSRDTSDGYSHLLLDLADHVWDPRLESVVSRADIVFHLAAKPGVRGIGRGVELARLRDNVVATRNLLSAVPLDVPVVAVSSSSVYGNRPAGGPSQEGDPLRPRGGYARSKVLMERACQARRAAGGLIAVVRPFTVAGEGQRSDMAFSLWLRALGRGEPIRIFGSQSRSRDITDVRDASEGLIRAGERAVNENVNLGTGVGHRLIDMATTLREVSGLDGAIVHEPGSAEEVDATLAATGRCQDLLGFVPETDLRSLLVRQIEASERWLVTA